ncbi:hypothetical protein DFJ74DRAFT_745319 [Hyaloraphidium curvatum]|nr:hypothetical protein DFJ74DRAFT_745319 [Hyaloraphidium curvatum]
MPAISGGSAAPDSGPREGGRGSPAADGLGRALALLGAPTDEAKFAALLLLPRLLSPDDADGLRRTLRAMDFAFLRRLVSAGAARSAPHDGPPPAELASVGAAVARQLAPLAADAPDGFAALARPLVGLLRGALDGAAGDGRDLPKGPEADAKGKGREVPQEGKDGPEGDSDDEEAEQGASRPAAANGTAADPGLAPADGETTAQMAAAALADMLPAVPAALDAVLASAPALAAAAALPRRDARPALAAADLLVRALLLASHRTSEPGAAVRSPAPLGEDPAVPILLALLPPLASLLRTPSPAPLLPVVPALLTFLRAPHPALLPALRELAARLLLRSRRRRAGGDESTATWRVLAVACEVYGAEFWEWKEGEAGEGVPSGPKALAVALGVVGAEIRVGLELEEGIEGVERMELDSEKGGEVDGGPSGGPPGGEGAPGREANGGAFEAGVEASPPGPDTSDPELPGLLHLLPLLIAPLFTLEMEPDMLLPLRRTLSEAYLAVAAFLAERTDAHRAGRRGALGGPVVRAAVESLASFLVDEEEATDMRGPWCAAACALFRTGDFPPAALSLLEAALDEDDGWRGAFADADGWAAVAVGLLLGPLPGHPTPDGAFHLLLDELLRHTPADPRAPAPARGTPLSLPPGVTPAMGQRIALCDAWRGNPAAACLAAVLLSATWELHPDLRSDALLRSMQWIVPSLALTPAADVAGLDLPTRHVAHTILGFPQLLRPLLRPPASRDLARLLRLLAATRAAGPWLPLAVAKRGGATGRQMVVDSVGGTLALGALVGAPGGWDKVLFAVGDEGHRWEREEEGFYD